MAEGVRLFNAQKFFEAHEALEALWLKAQGKEKVFLHGLIQVAAAFHHQSRDHRAGFHSLLEKGVKKLKGAGADQQGIDLDGLLKQLHAWQEFLSKSQPDNFPPPLPHIRTDGLRR